MNHLSDNLALKFTSQSESKTHDVWLCFKTSTGKHAMLSVAALADRSGHLIGTALREWASERLDEHFTAAIAAEDTAEETRAHDQFGVGS
jgi:hypothetical protein